MMLVLGTMTVLAVVVSLAFTVTLRSIALGDRAMDTRQALAAAEAGVDDFLTWMNKYDGYLTEKYYCGAPSKGIPVNVAMQQTSDSTRTCPEWAGKPLGWARVPRQLGSSYHYQVKLDETRTNGTITLDVTGKVGTGTAEQRRSMEVVLRRGGFGEFLYYTVYETIDPAEQATYGTNNTTAATECPWYFWGPENRPTSRKRNVNYCSDISFITGDKVNGPVHSNDAIKVSGNPSFLGTVSTSWPDCRAASASSAAAACVRRTSTSDRPTFAKGIGYRGEIELPTTIGDLKQYVTPSAAVPASQVGCLYTGPTRLRFNKPTSTTAAATMTVWSPYSTSVNANCGATGTATNGLGSTAGSTVLVPSLAATDAKARREPVVMVQNVPSSRTTPKSGACAAGSIGTYPVANDVNSTLRDADCRYGTLYIEGTLKGRMTMSADNDIIVTEDLVYAGGRNGTDALGLIAENSVKIYHPVEAYCSRYKDNNSNKACEETSYRNLKGPGGREVVSDPKIEAAILTLKHSFGVQSYQYGAPLGSIDLYGSIAQRFRGPVGRNSGNSISSGYLKNYSYDSRLRYAPPPHFLDPVKSGWGQKKTREVGDPFAS